MSSSTEIANLALSHLGIGKEISNIETDQSKEAVACRRYYTIARDATLRDFNWPFATKIAALGLVEEDPNSEWDFSYQQPSDCLKPRRILSGIRNDPRDSRVPYRLAQSDAGNVIFTDKEDAELEYTLRVEDVTYYPPDFVLALSYRLAGLIAPRITGGDNFQIGERAKNEYKAEISSAARTSLNEEQVEQDPDSEFIRARD